MNLHIRTSYYKWVKGAWFFETYRSGQELPGIMLWGRGFDLCVHGHLFSIRIHWRNYP
jgi:hypothetical protein